MDPWNTMNSQNMTPYGPPMQQGYPTLPNPYGIGAQIDASGGGGSGLAPVPQTQAGQSSQGLGGPAGPSQAGMASQPGYMANPVTTAPMQNGSNGFNPWSLTGEANARG